MKIFDVFRLIEKSVNLFARRLTLDGQRTLATRIESGPRPTQCHDRLIMVKFARLGKLYENFRVCQNFKSS